MVVADDEPDICLLLVLQLGLLSDLEVVGTATDGEEAVSECRRLRPDAMVVDLLMPGTSGLEAISAVRKHCPELGIVAYTGVAGDQIRKAIEQRGVALVAKSGDILPLAVAIRKVTLPLK